MYAYVNSEVIEEFAMYTIMTNITLHPSNKHYNLRRNIDNGEDEIKVQYTKRGIFAG